MKNPMKKLLKTALFASTVLVLAITSCQPEEEPTPADARDPFVASWAVAENSSQIGANNYTVHINKSTSNTSQVLIENLYNIGFAYKAVASIDGTNVTIAQQTYNGNQLRGSGSKTGANTITLTYYMNNGSTIDTCTATLTRQ